jgi:hypothetical protein
MDKRLWPDVEMNPTHFEAGFLGSERIFSLFTICRSIQEQLGDARVTPMLRNDDHKYGPNLGIKASNPILLTSSPRLY